MGCRFRLARQKVTYCLGSPITIAIRAPMVCWKRLSVVCLGQRFFERSGCQFLQINTLYQLLSIVMHKSPLLDVAETFLMIPDLFNFWLTGRKVCEFTDATTTQFYDPRKKDWSTEICTALSLPFEILPEVCTAGDTAWHVAPLRCSRDRTPRNTCYCPSLPRYRFSCRRCAGTNGQLGRILAPAHGH